MAKLDDLATDRERRHQLRALQRLRLIRQRREPAIHAALPIVGRPRDRTRRKAAQIAQRQREQPARAKCGRQRRQQAKRKCAGAHPGNDRQSRVIELLCVVAHRVGGREKRHKECHHSGENSRLPLQGESSADRHQDKSQLSS